jgi:hypothetical protein
MSDANYKSDEVGRNAVRVSVVLLLALILANLVFCSHFNAGGPINLTTSTATIASKTVNLSTTKQGESPSSASTSSTGMFAGVTIGDVIDDALKLAPAVIGLSLLFILRQPIVEFFTMVLILIKRLAGVVDRNKTPTLFAIVIAAVSTSLPEFDKAAGENRFVFGIVAGSLAFSPLIARLFPRGIGRVIAGVAAPLLFLAILAGLLCGTYPFTAPGTKVERMVTGWFLLEDRCQHLGPFVLFEIAVVALALCANIAVALIDRSKAGEV